MSGCSVCDNDGDSDRRCGNALRGSGGRGRCGASRSYSSVWTSSIRYLFHPIHRQHDLLRVARECHGCSEVSHLWSSER